MEPLERVPTGRNITSASSFRVDAPRACVVFARMSRTYAAAAAAVLTIATVFNSTISGRTRRDASDARCATNRPQRPGVWTSRSSIFCCSTTRHATVLGNRPRPRAGHWSSRGFPRSSARVVSRAPTRVLERFPVVHARRAPPSSPLSSRLASVVMVLVTRSTNFACIAWGATPCSSARVPRYPTTAAARTAPRSNPARSSPWTASSPAASPAAATAPFSASPTPTVGSSSANTATSSPRRCPSSTVSGPTRLTILVGPALRSHPTTSNLEAWRYPGFPTVVYPHGHVVWADSRVHLDDVTFVRVQGTTGWLFTRRAGRDVLRELDPRDMSDAMAASGESSGAFAAFEGVRGGCRTRRPRIGPFEFVSSTSSAVLRARPAPGHSRVRQEARASREIPQRSFHGGFVRQGYGRWGDGARGCVLRHGDDRDGVAHPERGKDAIVSGGCADRRRTGSSRTRGTPSAPEGINGAGSTTVRSSNNRAVCAMGVYLRDMAEATTEDEEVKLRGELRDLDAAMRELAKQRETLTDHLSAVEARSREGARLRMEGDLERHRELREQNLLARRGDRWTTTEAVHVSSPGLTRRCTLILRRWRTWRSSAPGDGSSRATAAAANGKTPRGSPTNPRRAPRRGLDRIRRHGSRRAVVRARGSGSRGGGRTRTPILRGVQRHT